MGMRLVARCFPCPFKSFDKAILSFLLTSSLGFSIVLSGCGGNQSTPKVTAPSNLAYPQTSITATIGQAVTADVPTVVGTVTSYSISPALPSGLSFDMSSGTISGTPTVAAPQATYSVTATNSAGSASAAVQIAVRIAAPSSLVYSQTLITATIGQAIVPDTPSVNGTESSYTISPGLPSGLSINPSSGTISGSATATSAKATYTVTASNATGNTVATIQIAVDLPAPSALVYPQTTITVAAGDAILPDIPTISGSSISYTVSPGLPSGLSLDSATGVISGIPTASSAQTPYTVSASNSGGSTTASVTITVLSTPSVLLELGHGAAVSGVRLSGNRLLSVDTTSHWVLWDQQAKSIIANGEGGPSSVILGGIVIPTQQIDLEAQTFAIGVPNGLDVRSAVDGHRLCFVLFPGLNQLASVNQSTTQLAWWRLASDGSYVTVGAQTGLSIFTLSGQLAAFKAGDYGSAKVFPAPGVVQVALGPVGQNVIETVSATDGTSTTSPQFSGQFNSWFLDGARFLTNTGNSVWEYSKAAVQKAIVALPSVENLTGQGNWVWTFPSSTPGYPINVYAVGADTPSLSYTATGNTINYAWGSGSAIGIIDSNGAIRVVDLSGTSPSISTYTPPIKEYAFNGGGVSNCWAAQNCPFAVNSSLQWVAAYESGAILDGSSLGTTPQYFGIGAPPSIAGSSSATAVSTAVGSVELFDASRAPTSTLAFSSGQVVLSSDGTVMAASGAVNDYQSDVSQMLNIYSLPSASILKTYPYSLDSSQSVLFDFTLSGSGTTLAQVSGTFSSPSGWTYTNKVTNVAGTTTYWLDHVDSVSQVSSKLPDLPFNALTLSPDGSLIAEHSGGSVTNIMQNGTLTSAVTGLSLGWIDNSRVIADEFNGAGTTYLGTNIYSSSGSLLTSPALPAMNSFQTVTSDSVYDPSTNQIYSLTTGQPTWTGTYPVPAYPNLEKGAISGSEVIYLSGHRLVVETY